MSKYDFDLEFLSESDDRSVISYNYNRNKVNDAMADTHKDDKNCFVRKYRGTDGKMKKLLLFGCGDVGTTIRNAVTGEKYYGHKVGSKSEDIYFKARLCTGEFGNDVPMLFYDSAEQYEKHMNCFVDQSIKDKVVLRQRLARVFAEDERKPRMNFVVR
jgi:hypothetical protein